MVSDFCNPLYVFYKVSWVRREVFLQIYCFPVCWHIYKVGTSLLLWIWLSNYIFCSHFIFIDLILSSGFFFAFAQICISWLWWGLLFTFFTLPIPISDLSSNSLLFFSLLFFQLASLPLASLPLPFSILQSCPLPSSFLTSLLFSSHLLCSLWTPYLAAVLLHVSGGLGFEAG